jgi:hypothetical protein
MVKSLCTINIHSFKAERERKLLPALNHLLWDLPNEREVSFISFNLCFSLLDN